MQSRGKRQMAPLFLDITSLVNLRHVDVSNTTELVADVRTVQYVLLLIQPALIYLVGFMV